ncbi:response regulator [Anaerolineales bacterium HSG25]|nr:response regulator [Anaerolineales bacterium HSG25]
MKILYIEDNETQGSILKRMLEMMGGHEVNWVKDGQSALEITRASDWTTDVIITDRRLPNMTGSEFIEACKCNPNLADVPIIMLSADLAGIAEEEALSAGATAYFAKPVDFDKLDANLKKLVGHD